jgi:hypothetical protein
MIFGQNSHTIFEFEIRSKIHLNLKPLQILGSSWRQEDKAHPSVSHGNGEPHREVHVISSGWVNSETNPAPSLISIEARRAENRGRKKRRERK